MVTCLGDFIHDVLNRNVYKIDNNASWRFRTRQDKSIRLICLHCNLRGKNEFSI